MRPRIRVTVLAFVIVAFLTLLGSWPSSTLADGDPDPAIGEVTSLGPAWDGALECHLYRSDVMCGVEAFLVCRELGRIDLCEWVGQYPKHNVSDEYLVFGFGGESDLPVERPTLVQYRLVGIATDFKRYGSPLVIVELDIRSCRGAKPDFDCTPWSEQYIAVWQPRGLETIVAAWGER